jgi:hypothetical protein
MMKKSSFYVVKFESEFRYLNKALHVLECSFTVQGQRMMSSGRPSVRHRSNFFFESVLGTCLIKRS